MYSVSFSDYENSSIAVSSNCLIYIQCSNRFPFYVPNSKEPTYTPDSISRGRARAARHQRGTAARARERRKVGYINMMSSGDMEVTVWGRTRARKPVSDLLSYWPTRMSHRGYPPRLPRPSVTHAAAPDYIYGARAALSLFSWLYTGV